MPSAFSNSPQTPRSVTNINFTTATVTGRVDSGGTGSFGTGTSGLFIGMTGGSAAYEYVGATIYPTAGSITFPVFSNNPVIGFTLMNNSHGFNFFSTTNTGNGYIGLGKLVPDVNNKITFTGIHVGFKIIADATSVRIYGSQADGTTENITAAITTIAADDILDLSISVLSGVGVTYYVSKNRGSLLTASLTSTNLPTVSILAYLGFMVDNNNGTTATGINIQSASYQ